MNYRLQDLIDINRFQNLQDRLNKIFSFPSSIIDNQGNILTATAWQDICMQFHRKNKESEKICLMSDQYISDHIHEANPTVTYRCPLGLVDNATPIVIDGTHYGNFFTGQFFLEKPALDFFKDQARKYGFDEKTYLDAVNRVPIWTREQLDSYLFFIKELIEVIVESGLKKAKEIENKKKIKMSEERYRIVSSQIPGMLYQFVIHADKTYSIPFVSEKVHQYLGYTPGQITEQPQLFYRSIHPDDVAIMNDEVQKSANDLTDFEVQIRMISRKDETKWFSFRSTPVCLENGDILWNGISIDITKLKETESHFRIMAEMLDEAPNSITIHDSEGNFHYANHKTVEMHGYAPDDFMKLNLRDLDVLESEVLISQRMEMILDKGEASFAVSHCRKDGSTLPMEVFVKLVQWKDQPAMMSIATDITGKKEMELRLQQAQKMEAIGNLAGGIAHDFNNILFPIVGMSELMLEDLPIGSPEHDNAKEILKAGRRGSDLVKQILAFSRQAKHKMMPIQLHHILKEVLKLVRSTIPANIVIKQNIQSGCGLVYADPTQIHQVAMNLITNAYHAVESIGGEIVLELKETEIDQERFSDLDLNPGKYAMLMVSDTGCGIQPDVMEKIFEPYFTTKDQGKGTGLGLAVVDGIVKEHNGEIKVVSEVGHGTVFYVYLPIIEKGNTVDPSKIEVIDPTGNENILLVDDEAAIVRLERQMLEKLGYRITERTSSPDALKTFSENPYAYDLVITDMTMPNMTGDQLARELIAIRPDIPIIICTGFSERINLIERPSFVKGVLMKPVIKNELAKTVRAALDAALTTS